MRTSLGSGHYAPCAARHEAVSSVQAGWRASIRKPLLGVPQRAVSIGEVLPEDFFRSPARRREQVVSAPRRLARLRDPDLRARLAETTGELVGVAAVPDMPRPPRAPLRRPHEPGAALRRRVAGAELVDLQLAALGRRLDRPPGEPVAGAAHGGRRELALESSEAQAERVLVLLRWAKAYL